MLGRILLVFLAAACATCGNTPAQAFRLGPAGFTSAGGGPNGSPFVLGMSLGQSVAGGPSPAMPPATEEGAGFWRWGHVLTLDAPTVEPTVTAWALSPGAPNPFSNRTLVHYAIPASAGEVGVQLRIYDLSGRLVRTLDSGRRAAGVHALAWDGRDDAGHALGGGVYFCRVTAGSYAATQRLVLAR